MCYCGYGIAYIILVVNREFNINLDSKDMEAIVENGAVGFGCVYVCVHSKRENIHNARPCVGES